MGHLDHCVHCDRGEHGLCDGTVSVIDQDGHSRYVCRCLHRRAVLERQRVEDAERKVRRLMRDLGIDRSHALVEASVIGRTPTVMRGVVEGDLYLSEPSQTDRSGS